MWTTLAKYCELYPWPTEQGLRWMIWRIEAILGKQAPFVARFGRRVLIDAEAFQKWVAENGAKDWKLSDEVLKAKREQKRKLEAVREL